MQPGVRLELLDHEARDIGSRHPTAVEAAQIRECANLAMRRLVVEGARAHQHPVQAAGADQRLLAILVLVDLPQQSGWNR